MTRSSVATPAAPRPAIVAGCTTTVVAAIAPLLAEPGIASPQISQRLAGARVEVLEEDGDWLLVRGSDGYEGWMHRGFVAHAGAAAPTDGRLSLGCLVRDGAGHRRRLPLGALLAATEVLEDGKTIPAAERGRWFPTDAAAIIQSARTLFTGTSYQWGGLTPWGADCSGFVQAVFGLHGVPLPRDAWQQARTGEDAGTDPMALRSADLLFFSDRADLRITHVAIALGEGRIAHCALGRGGYAVERLWDRNDPYVLKLVDRFLFARRVL